MIFPPRAYRRLGHRIDEDPPGFDHDGSVLDAEHRRRIISGARQALGLSLGSAAGDPSYCTADTTVSSSSFVSVTGMAQTIAFPLTGTATLAGALYIEEVTPGQLQVQITAAGVAVWGPVTIQQFSALLLEGAQTMKTLLPIGGPALLDIVGGETYALDVEIAAPAGSYSVLAGTGKESWLQATPVPATA